ncbi:tetratricopeptide repeat protein [Antarcticibacterium arcticum]|uniref:Tetratricopeptide repeat protein n=1 Tax=Antarcticibacterium arcticum TaxID=2585771 RepID=A0A5B8YFF9_9FLAO|nr:tetratricopeptide repeat protein [Antarcticibacterium arcticum]QED36670.1 tetratricopeptide repeat protein [Antarcticibacterium arcticum]
MSSFKFFLPVLIFLFSFISPGTSQILPKDKKPENKVKAHTTHKMEAGDPFTHGREMLHHMMYEQAAELFQEAIQKDPNNAMAHWGLAMTALRPLWAPPNSKDFENGLLAVEKAQTLGHPGVKEREEIEALHNYYITAKDAGYRQGLAAWKTSLENLYNKYPDDIEIASFYGLSLLATAPQDDKTYSQQQKAGALMEEMHKKDPMHPAPFHYSIHAYDNPVLAEKGIRFANAYDQLAPDVPHALHMPSHIFVRVGKWDETIQWNLRSAESALRQPHGEMTSYHHAHALDYLIYAYLQQGLEDKAKGVLAELNSIEKYQPNFAAAYAIAAAPSRYLLERRKWNEAGDFMLDSSKGFPWENFPQMEAISWWTRGLGAAMSNDTDLARESVEKLKSLEEQTRENDEEYWALLVNTQRKTIEAWILHNEGNYEKALALMTEAAEQEDSVEKHPVTPGNVLPARELLGDMLVLQNKPDEARAAYKAALEISPNRFNSLYGAGNAAVLAGRNDLARDYFQQLHKIASKESKRPELDVANSFVQKK